MFVRDLTPGVLFTTPDSRGTVYRCVSVRTQDGYAYVSYTLEGEDFLMGYGTRPLSTVYPVSVAETA